MTTTIARTPGIFVGRRRYGKTRQHGGRLNNGCSNWPRPFVPCLFVSLRLVALVFNACRDAHVNKKVPNSIKHSVIRIASFSWSPGWSLFCVAWPLFVCLFWSLFTYHHHANDHIAQQGQDEGRPRRCRCSTDPRCIDAGGQGVTIPRGVMPIGSRRRSQPEGPARQESPARLEKRARVCMLAAHVRA